MLNLTVDIFGRRINFFEFNLRMKGLEKLVEQNMPKEKTNKRKSRQTQPQFTNDDVTKFDSVVRHYYI